VAFLLSVSKGLSQFDFSSLDSIAGLDVLSEVIFRLLLTTELLIPRGLLLLLALRSGGTMSVGLY